MAKGLVEYQWLPDPIVVANEYELMALRFEQRSEVMHEALQVVIEDVGSQFDQEGPGWAPWSEDYADSDQHGPAILDREGALREGAESPGSYEVNREFISWTGAEAPQYWRFHAFGTYKMPQRTWIGLTPEGDAKVMAVFAAWLETL